MKLEFALLFCALAILTAAKAQSPLDNPLTFPKPWFEAPEPEEEVPVDIGANMKFDESTTESTTTAALSESETETDFKTTLATQTVASTTTMGYTDEFHPDPFLAASIKAAKSPIYQRLREPPPQGYDYDFLKEM